MASAFAHIAENLESPKSGLDGEISLRLNHDLAALQELRKNLSIRALFIPLQSEFPLRSRVGIHLRTSEKLEPIFLVGDVVFNNPNGVGLEIREFASADLQKFDRFLNGLPKVEAKARAPKEPVVVEQVSVPVSKVARRGSLVSDLPNLMSRGERLGTAGDTNVPDTIFDLLIRIAADQGTGLLTIKGENKKTQISYRSGRIVGIHSTPCAEEETIAYRLKKRKELTGGQYCEVLRKVSDLGISEEKLLQQEVDEGTLRIAIREAMYERLGRCIAIKKVTYQFEEGLSFVRQMTRFPLGLYRALYRGIICAAGLQSMDELFAGLESNMSHYVIKRDPPPFEPRILHLDSKEFRFLETSLEKPVRLQKLFSISALSRIKTLHTIYAMYFLGYFEFSSQSDVQADEIIPHLTATAAEMDGMNHFEILQVHWAALFPEIQTKFERARQLWKSVEIPEMQRSQAAPLLQKILARMQSSHDFLSDNTRRRCYRDELIDKPKQKFGAELFSQHTKTYLLRGDFKQAREYIEMAIDLCPTNVEYKELRKACGRKP